jgi:MFS family permease
MTTKKTFRPSHDASSAQAGRAERIELNTRIHRAEEVDRLRHHQAEPASEWPSPWRAWSWVFVLVLAYMSSYVDRQILSLMVDPIKADLGISDSQFSLLHGLSFALLYCTFGIPLGGLVDRYPRRQVIAGGILLWSAMTAACGLAGRFWHLFVARVGVGVGEAALSPGAYSLLSDSFPKHRLGLALSVYTTGAGLGAGLAYLVGGSLYSWVDALPREAIPLVGGLTTWQTVFVIVAVPGVPIAALIWLLREPARHGRSTALPPAFSDVLGFIASRGRFMTFFLLAMSLATAATMGTMAWAPAALMRRYGLTAADAGFRLGLVTMVAFPLGLLAGAWAARRFEKRGSARSELTVSAAAQALAAITAVVLGLVAGENMVLGMFAGLIFFTNVPFGIAAAALQSLTPNEMRGRMTAIYLFTVNLFGMTLGPLLPALWTDYVLQGEGTNVAASISVTVAVLTALASIFFAAADHQVEGRCQD